MASAIIFLEQGIKSKNEALVRLALKELYSKETSVDLTQLHRLADNASPQIRATIKSYKPCSKPQKSFISITPDRGQVPRPAVATVKPTCAEEEKAVEPTDAESLCHRASTTVMPGMQRPSSEAKAMRTPPPSPSAENPKKRQSFQSLDQQEHESPPSSPISRLSLSPSSEQGDEQGVSPYPSPDCSLFVPPEDEDPKNPNGISNPSSNPAGVESERTLIERSTSLYVQARLHKDTIKRVPAELPYLIRFITTETGEVVYLKK